MTGMKASQWSQVQPESHSTLPEAQQFGDGFGAGELKAGAAVRRSRRCPWSRDGYCRMCP